MKSNEIRFKGEKTMYDFIKHFSEISQHNIGEVGDKGANLAALATAGCLVPPGFCITTHAYREFVKHSGLEEYIASILTGVNLSMLEHVQTCGAAVRLLIMEHEIPERIKEPILSAYWRLFTLPPVRGKLYVAVRSSATAKDLPDMAFIGQHDTYLNIFGASDLLFSVKKCWASLWSDQAIVYRHKNNINHTKVLMAVIIQRMAPSAVSRVPITANLLTGNHTDVKIHNVQVCSASMRPFRCWAL